MRIPPIVKLAKRMLREQRKNDKGKPNHLKRATRKYLRAIDIINRMPA